MTEDAKLLRWLDELRLEGVEGTDSLKEKARESLHILEYVYYVLSSIHLIHVDCWETACRRKIAMYGNIPSGGTILTCTILPVGCVERC